MDVKLLVERGSPYFILEQKDSFFHSKLCTDITTNIQNVSVDLPPNEIHEQNQQNKISVGLFYKKTQTNNHNDELNLKEQQNISKKLMDDKLSQIQQKSNKIIQMIPKFQGNGEKGKQMTKMFNDFNFGIMEENLMTAKLKIIRDLQDKISLLQENISKPNVCQQYLRNIQQEINLDFQNYEHETKDNNIQINNNQQSNVQFNSNVDSQTLKQPSLEPFFSKFFKKQTIEVPICISVPKIVQIQIPVNIIKIKQYYTEECKQDQTKKKVASKNKLRFSKSKSDSGEYRRSDESSIEYIINDFSRRFNYEEDYMKDVDTNNQYQIPQIVINPPQIQSVQKDQFNLPLDSFQQNKSDFHEEKEKQYGMRRTDRSYMSSNSEVQKIRDQLWKKDMMQFNQQQLSKVKQSQNNLDESYEDNNGELDINSRDSKSSLKKQLTELTQELIMVKAQLDRKQDQLQILLKITKQMEAKSVYQYAQLIQLTHNYDQLVHKNTQLSQSLKRCESEIDRLLINEKYLNNKNIELEKCMNNLIEQRSNEVYELFKVIKDKDDQIQQSNKISHQLQKLLHQKQHSFQQHIHSLQIQINELKDGKQFYKRKLEEEGINLNLQEANIIRDLIEKKQNKQVQLQILQKKYCQIVQSLKAENRISEKCIQQLKKQNQRLTKLYQSEENQMKIESSLMSLIKDYNCELGKKEQQIDHLRKMTERANILLQEATNSSELQVNAINSIKSLLLSEKCDGKQQSLHFIYITDRLIRHIKLYEYNLIRQKQQRVRITKKLTELNLYINKEIEQSERKTQKLLNQNNRYKKQNQQLASQLRKIGSKLNVFKSKADQNSKLTAIHLQNEFLQLQNKKLLERYRKLKSYSQDLQQKMISSFEVTGNSFSESFCSYLRQFIQKQKEQNYLTQMEYQKLVKKIKYEMSKSTKAKPIKITLASGVLSYCNKHSKALSKSILMPLPEIPVTGALLPNIITLDKLLIRKNWGNEKIKSNLISKILDLCCELVRVNRKLFHLKPCQIQVSGLNGKMEIIIHRQFGSMIQEEDETNLLYRAPQVLLDFTESEASYVWTVGIIIDQIFHQKLFYKKINDIKSRKDNYQVRDTTLKVKDLLVQMLRKNQKDRPTLSRVKEQLSILQ